MNRSASQKDLACWRNGVILDDKKTLPASVKLARSDSTGQTLKIVLTEGRNRQIRRVAKQLGYQVEMLHRSAIGSISLDLVNGSQLAAGKHRSLTSTEINFLKNSFNLKSIKATAQPRSAVDESK